MTREDILTLCRERMANWMEYLASKHATPAVIVGVGHDHVSGVLFVCCPQDMPESMLLDMMRGAVEILEGNASKSESRKAVN